MMDPFLKHVVEITTHRDHTLLDISVISALRELANLNSVRLLDILSLHDQIFLRQKAWTQNGIILSGDEESGTEQALEPLAAFAELADAIAQRRILAQGLSGDGTAHFLWLPVWLNDKPISCLELRSNAPFSSQTCSMAEGILSVYRNFQGLLDYSERDSLTGLFNRKTFDEKFTKIASLADARQSAEAPAGEVERRMQKSVKDQWLAVVDIDHFKKVNDEYGHLYGDEVLILLSNILKSSFRSRDRIFRFGGEEFVIMLRSITQQNAYAVFERFRECVEAYPFPQVGRVTVSLGFVRISGDTPVVILGRADQALYYAKSNGRNRVCFYDDLVTKGLLQPENTSSAVEFF
jgi:diguanylate cyclase (GGDEF)-like protein